MARMSKPGKVLVVQTAFLGDVILTLPLVQSIKSSFPDAEIDILVIPGTAEALVNHPSIREIIPFDKRGADSGLNGFLRLARRLRETGYDTAVVPHRSLRSAALARWAGIPRRIGFESSAGRFLLTDRLAYDKSAHEINRNLRLLEALGVKPSSQKHPELYPSVADREAVDRFLGAQSAGSTENLIGIAPGTVWNTKRWPADRFADLAGKLLAEDWQVVVVGGRGDKDLLSRFFPAGMGSPVIDATGKLTILQSAELIGRCRVLVCNDSAPMHLAAAVRTPVVALFGATVPAFGFGPVGPRDIVLETNGLSCRPCSIHGGRKCPIGSFVCMLNITPEQVVEAVNRVVEADV